MLYVMDAAISIHAPLRERLHALSSIVLMVYFNPRSLTGATGRTHKNPRCHVLFQSTLPYGSDGQQCRRKHRCYHFNPRSLTGATEKYADIRQRMAISIHAPLRERLEAVQGLIDTIKFQSTLPYGSDYVPESDFRFAVGFQSTLPYGSDVTRRSLSLRS